MIDFYLITYADLPALDPDDVLLAEALSSRGLTWRPAIWDDPSVDWSGAKMCVVRSAWNYHLKRDQFLSWVEQANSVSRVINSPRLIMWNSHKGYLRELSQNGIDIVPTLWAGRESQDAVAAARENGWTNVIVKPAVGLATFGVKQFDISNGGAAEASRHIDSLSAANEVMIQPFINSVADYGERALVFIDGQYSHAVRKTHFQPLMPAGLAGEYAVDASSDEIAAAGRALESLPEKPVYARVDLVRSDSGMPLIIELELVEPSLFFSMHPPSAQKMAESLSSLL